MDTKRMISVCFKETEVLPRESAIIAASNDYGLSLFRGEEITLKESREDSIGVVLIFVGHRTQLPVPKDIKGTSIKDFNCWWKDMKWDTLEKGLEISIFVTNRSDETARFSGEIKGHGVI